MKKPSVTTVTTVTSLGTHTHTKYARAYAHTMREIYLFIYFHTHTGACACARGWREGVCVCPTPPGAWCTLRFLVHIARESDEYRGVKTEASC